MILAGLLERHITRRANSAQRLWGLQPLVASSLLSSRVGTDSFVWSQRETSPRWSGSVTEHEENDHA